MCLSTHNSLYHPVVGAVELPVILAVTLWLAIKLD